MSETDRIDWFIDGIINGYYKIPKFIRFIMLPLTFAFLATLVTVAALVVTSCAIVAQCCNYVYNAYKNYQ